jgi:hypothetical protein
MKIKTFKGFSEFYPKNLDGTSEWFFGVNPFWEDANDVKEFNSEEYEGNRLVIFNIDGTAYEPFKKERHIFIENPIYDSAKNTFGLLKYDFNLEKIQMYEYKPKEDFFNLLTEIPFEEGGDFINLKMLVKEPFALVKFDIHDDKINFLYPFKKTFDLEPNEILCYIDSDTFITSKWTEDPDYREETITRKLSDGSIVKRENGYIREMPDGTIWKMTD